MAMMGRRQQFATSESQEPFDLAYHEKSRAPPPTCVYTRDPSDPQGFQKGNDRDLQGSKDPDRRDYTKK